ncbi:MAG TPA: DinB family protein [Tepidisphaeraceae bacterium]|jgi:hypothetical protein
MSDALQAIRNHVLDLLKGGNAHLTFDEAVADLPPALHGGKPPGQPHTPWRLLEHMRIAQWDILEFTRNPKHKSPKWPDEYWPAGDAPPHAEDWNRSIRQFHADARAMQGLVADPRQDLLAPIPGGQGQTLLREALLVADHNAYHLGQLVFVRRLLGAWED